MKNLKRIAQASMAKNIELYYSIKDDAVYDRPGEGRWHVTTLIRANTEAEIVAAVRRFMAL